MPQNPMQMIQAFNQFRKNYTNETAEQKVRELVASGVNVSNLLTVLDEHMDVIKLLHPKEYETLIQKIRELA